MNQHWRNARMVARTLLKGEVRPHRLRAAHRLLEGSRVSSRLLDQAVASLSVELGKNYEQELDRFGVVSRP